MHLKFSVSVRQTVKGAGTATPLFVTATTPPIGTATPWTIGTATPPPRNSCSSPLFQLFYIGQQLPSPQAGDGSRVIPRRGFTRLPTPISHARRWESGVG